MVRCSSIAVPLPGCPRPPAVRCPLEICAAEICWRAAAGELISITESRGGIKTVGDRDALDVLMGIFGGGDDGVEY